MQKRWIRKNLKNKLRIGHTVVEWGIQASELWESCLSGSLVPRQDGFVPLKFNSQSNKSKTLLANTCERVERGNYFYMSNKCNFFNKWQRQEIDGKTNSIRNHEKQDTQFTLFKNRSLFQFYCPRLFPNFLIFHFMGTTLICKKNLIFMRKFHEIPKFVYTKKNPWNLYTTLAQLHQFYGSAILEFWNGS